MQRYLAVDIGATSGRHIVGWLQNGKFETEEVYRFDNFLKNENGHLVWNLQEILNNVQIGIAKALASFGDIISMSVDTWAVDYVLMSHDKEILPCYAYRDYRTQNYINKVHSLIPFEELYSRTGIQFQPFNTIYQLYCDKEEGRLNNATDFLMLPEYIIYKLTGIKLKEYTNATSTGLINASTGKFDKYITNKLGFPERLFCDIADNYKVGMLKEKVSKIVGGNLNVCLCATHDTACAVIATPLKKDFESPYISSGTWSLLGIEQKTAHTDNKSLSDNFSNEGGYKNTFRYQKNIMGLWMLQSVRREMGIDFAEGERLARANRFDYIVDCNKPIFMAPASMSAAVKKELNKDITNGQLLYCIYNSLANYYKKTLEEMQNNLQKKFYTLNIIGGGSSDSFLNELTAKSTGVKIIAGPSEATALGNIIIQMIIYNELRSINEARKIIKNSFSLKTY